MGNDRSGTNTGLDTMNDGPNNFNNRGTPKKPGGNIQGPIKGNALFGRVYKLSGWGFSLNERFLKLNKMGLCYFSKPPVT